MGKCIITYKGKKYSEEQFKEYFINNKQEFATSIARNKDVIDSFKRKMEGIDFVFSQSPELASVGSKAQYLQYLSTIFKTSKVKDIVYHGTNEKFDKFDKTKLGTKTVNETNKLGFYFSTKRIAEIFNGNFNLSDFLFHIRDSQKESKKFFEKLQVRYGKEKAIEIYKELINLTNDSTGLHSLSKLDAPDSKIIPSLLNIKNPFYIEGIDFIGMTRGGGIEGSKLIKSKIKKEDSIIIKKATEEFEGEDEVQDDNYVVFEPEQIHILSSKADIQGFKNFMSFENSEFSKYGTYQQFRDFVTSKSSIEIENRLIEIGKIDRVC